MVTQIKQTLQYYYRYSFKPVGMFWLIYFFFLTLMLVLSLHDDIALSITGATSFPSMIFIIFFSLLTFKNVFPFVIKLGVSRKAYMLSTYIYGLLLSLFMVVLNYIYLYFFNLLVNVFSIEGFDYIGLNMGEFADILTGNAYLFDLLVHLSLFLLFTLIGGFFYRFGMIYGVILIAIFPLSMLIKSVGTKIIELLSYLAIFHENYTPLSFLIIILSCLIVNWLIVHRSSTVDQITKQH
ncbi:MAG TPA: hypothetical protein GXZ58_03005 [Bacilli bacterium]|mgnify:CR=1 FL=1|nr:hypothetical protein [Bacilli bacterium]